MPRLTYAVVVCGGLLAAFGVADARVGLALSVLLLLLVTTAVTAAPRGRSSWAVAVLAVGLALQPLLRDAGWVVALDGVAVLAAAGLLVTGAATWRAVVSAVRAPLRVVAGTALMARATAAIFPDPRGRDWLPIARGTALAALLVSTFGALFITADAAFAELAGHALDVRIDGASLLWRAVLGMGATALGSALAMSGAAHVNGPQPRPRVLGEVELRIGLASLVALFVLFVVVQLQVLFGGSGYVARTTGLGLGDYARQGFTQMLAVAALTLGVVAFAARRPDRVVRGLLGALCLLCLVVLASAQHRLGLVVDAYGLTRTRISGAAVVPWLAAIFVLVLTAGLFPSVTRAAPRIAVVGTLAAILAFSVSNPDSRVAHRAAAHFARTGQLDLRALTTLSADAAPALRELPEPARTAALSALASRLQRADGLAGFNVARAAARRR